MASFTGVKVHLDEWMEWVDPKGIFESVFHCEVIGCFELELILIC
jgi:hypothetical protein